MIIASSYSMQVGHRIDGECTDLNNEYRPFVAIVLREATKQEFLDHLESVGYDITQYRWDHPYHYEVSTD